LCATEEKRNEVNKIIIMVRIGIGIENKNRRLSYEQIDLREDEDTIDFSSKEKKILYDVRYDAKGHNGKYCDDELDDTDKEQNLSRRKETVTLHSLIDMKRRYQPSSSFQRHKPRFPSYKRISRRIRKAKNEKGQHQPLAVNEDDAQNEGKEDLYNKDLISNRLMKRLSISKDCIDPIHYPLEQCTDAEYGFSNSHASFDSSSVDYNPTDLEKMGATRNMYDEKRLKMRKFFVMASTIILVLIVVICIVLGNAARERDNRKNDYNNIQLPPEDLEKLCNRTNTLTDFGLKQCKDACDAAHCCMGTAGKSCFTEFENICGLYSSCGILYQAVEGDTLSVAPAPKNIGSICSDKSIATPKGFEACQSACRMGECCFPSNGNENNLPDESCVETHEDKCKTYTPCLSLHIDGKELTSTVDVVNTKCTINNVHYLEGWDDCSNACQPRSCCFTEESNCRKDNEFYCNEYEACEIIFNQPQPKGWQKTPSETSKCYSIEALSSTDFNDCKKICDNVQCCLNGDDGCDEGCGLYEFCSSFWGHSDLSQILPAANQSPQQIPSTQEIENACTHETTLNECSSLCSPYFCCFSDSQKKKFSSCYSNEICTKYSSCSKIVGEQKERLNLICSLDNLATESGIKQCDTLCKSHMCCFNVDESCDDSSDCFEYQACQNVLHLDGDVDNLLLEGEKKLMPALICSTDNLATEAGVEQCKELCKRHMCCFNVDEPCEDSSDCFAFQACQILSDLNNDIDLSSICSFRSIATDEGRKKCDSICNVHECCMTGECKDVQCKTFSSCKNLYRNNNEQNNIQYLEQYCTGELIMKDTSLKTKCLQICNRAKCCSSGKCSGAKSFCDSYQVCDVLWSSSELETEETSDGDLYISSAVQRENYEDDCKPEKTRTEEGKQKCEKACAPWSCCWSMEDIDRCHYTECIFAIKMCDLFN